MSSILFGKNYLLNQKYHCKIIIQDTNTIANTFSSFSETIQSASISQVMICYLRSEEKSFPLHYLLISSPANTFLSISAVSKDMSGPMSRFSTS